MLNAKFDDQSLAPPKLSDLWPRLLVPELKKDEAMTIKLLHEIKEGLTARRGNGGLNYVFSSEQVSVYTLFYLTTNWPKFKFVLRQLPDEFHLLLAQSHFIDLGTGPGTYALAFYQWKKFFLQHLSFLDRGEFKDPSWVLGLDQSPVMLEQAKKLIHGPFFDEQISFRESHLEVVKSFLKASKEERPVVLFFGHSLNEMGAQKAMEWIKSIGPSVLFFLEPGTPAAFGELIKLREELAKNFVSVYPCAHLGASCPKAQIEGDWCHQILRTRHELELESLMQKARMDRHNMPLLAHVYYRPGALLTLKTDTGLAPVLTRYFGESKLGRSFEFCYSDSKDQRKENLLAKALYMKRDENLEVRKKLDALSVGDRLIGDLAEVRKDGQWRFKLMSK